MILGNIWHLPAIWMGMAFAASVISIRIGISVALGTLSRPVSWRSKRPSAYHNPLGQSI
jgi:hypothetical protein